MAGKEGVRLYTPQERDLLRLAAAKLVRQQGNVMNAAALLVQEKKIPLHDAIAFVAIAKHARQRQRSALPLSALRGHDGQ
jgi:hypothetical protein